MAIISVLAVLGNIASACGYLVPLSSFIQVYSTGSTGTQKSLPYVVALFSATAWLYYGLLKHDMALVSVYAIGCIFETVYIIAYLYYATRQARITALKQLLSIEVICSCIVFFCTYRFRNVRRIRFVGLICVGISTCALYVPVSDLVQVIRARAIEILSLPSSASAILSATIWLIYGSLKNDVYVMVVNGLGLFIGCLQVILYAIYRNFPEKTRDEEKCDDERVEAQRENAAGDAAYQMKDLEAALVHYSKAIQLDETNPSYVLNRAFIYLEIEKREECEKDLDLVFEKGRKVINPAAAPQEVRPTANAIELATRKPHVCGENDKSTRPVNWHPPLAGRKKLNVDGSVQLGTENPVGIGGLFRDDKGVWILGFMGNLERRSPLETELWAIYRGLTIALSKEVKEFQIETDANLAVKLINDELSPNCLFRVLIQDIKFLLLKCNAVVEYVPREGNVCADHLAKLGRCMTQEFELLEEPPASLLPLLDVDFRGCDPIIS